MPQANITVKGSSDLDLLTRTKIINELAILPTDVLKRLNELQKIQKAKSYLESDVKFATLKGYLKF